MQDEKTRIDKEYERKIFEKAVRGDFADEEADEAVEDMEAEAEDTSSDKTKQDILEDLDVVTMSKKELKEAKKAAKKAAKAANKKKRIGITVAVIIIFLIVGGATVTYFLLFTPEKRLERYIDKAEEAVSVADYKLAVEYYDKALDIDDVCYEAMLGKLSTLLAAKDTGTLIVTFEEYVQVIDELGAEEVAKNSESIKKIYLYAADVYEGSNERIVVYDTAYKKLSDPTFASHIVIEYLAIAFEKQSEGDFEAELAAYESALTYEANNEEVHDKRKKTVDERISQYISEGKLDAAEDLILRYQSIIEGIDFATYQAEVDRLRYIEEQKLAVMSTCYAYMKDGDYTSMHNLDGSDAANFVGDNIEEYCIYAPDMTGEAYTGTAAGMYKLSSGGYYFYYGEYVDGVRSGSGKIYMLKDKEDSCYYVFEGTWANDMPNGVGTESIINENINGVILTTIETGNYTDGYADGDFEGTIKVGNGEEEEPLTYTGKWTASMGQAEDVNASYSDWNFANNADYVLYAVFLNEDESDAYAMRYKKSSFLGINLLYN